MNKATRQTHFFRFGIALIAVGVICNEWTLAKLFSPDGELLLTNRIFIWIFDIGISVLGALLALFSKTLGEEGFFLRFVKSHPRFTAIIFGVGFSIVLLICAEAVFYFLLRCSNGVKTIREGEYASGGYFVDDPVLGYKPKPGIRASSILKRNDKTIYDVVYTIDELGRRTTPVNNPERRDEFALFFGCSCTFGEGVNDDETMPCYFGRLSENLRPYNYGFHGYGPQEMLAKLESGTLAKELDSNRGLLVYSYLVGHEERVLGSMYVYNGWGSRMPYYSVDAKGHLSRQGNFTTGRPVRSLIYAVLGKMNILKFFKFNYPFKVTDSDYRLTAKIIEKSQELYSKTFGDNRFYVVILPARVKEIEIIPHLKKAGIKYFDYSQLLDPTSDEYKIVGEGHPAPKSYAIIAEHLFEDLSKLEAQ